VKKQIQPQRLASLIDCTTHNLAQHVVSAFVAGQNAVSNGKRRSACVIGDHAHGEAFLSFRFVMSVGEGGGVFDNRAD
jgi:hypothetical protein